MRNSVDVTLIRALGKNPAGTVLQVHPNMKEHLIKTGHVENPNIKKSTVLSEAEPIILKAAEPVKIEPEKPKKVTKQKTKKAK